MDFAEFILANIEPITAEWEDFAKTCTPATFGMSRTELLDDVRRILRAIADDMRQPQTPAEQEAKGKGQASSGPLGDVAASHIGMRIQSRFDLSQIVSEYRAIRASILRLWARSYRVSGETADIIRFGEAIDQSVAEIVPTYLQREAQYRDRFFGMLGHDLRTPLSAILLSASTLSGENGLSESGAKCVARILRSCQRMDTMVRDILDFTRGRFGEPMQIRRVPVDLRRILRNTIDELQCVNPNTTIFLSATGDLHGGWDSERMSQLIANLIANAIQHGAAKKVLVSAADEPEHILLEVHNDGPPIPEELVPKLFQPLERERPSVGSHDGLGLGLFICKEIVKAHGGTIGVASSFDAGTTFSVRINRSAD